MRRDKRRLARWAKSAKHIAFLAALPAKFVAFMAERSIVLPRNAA